MTGQQMFNEALKNAANEKRVKELVKQARNRKVKELVAQGIDKMIAESMVDAFDTCGLSIHSL